MYTQFLDKHLFTFFAKSAQRSRYSKKPFLRHRDAGWDVRHLRWKLAGNYLGILACWRIFRYSFFASKLSTVPGWVIADSNCARSLVLWFEHCGMTELLPHAWDTRGGLIGLPSSWLSALHWWDPGCSPDAFQASSVERFEPFYF